LKIFSEKWKLLFRNVRLFIKISTLSEDFFREIEAVSRIAKLFKCIFNRIEAFVKICKVFSKNPIQTLIFFLQNTESEFVVFGYISQYILKKHQ
jgi:hypothetical protein